MSVKKAIADYLTDQIAHRVPRTVDSFTLSLPQGVGDACAASNAILAAVDRWSVVQSRSAHSVIN
jgi:hypothetical protein